MELRVRRHPKAASALALAILVAPVLSTAASSTPSAPPAQLALHPPRIVGTVPAQCSSQGQSRQTIVLEGEFPAVDAHGAALIVSQTGRPPVAVPYDPSAIAVPSFTYSPRDGEHRLNVVFDGRSWCTGTGFMQLQIALGGRMSNTYSVQITDDDDDE